MAIVLIEEASNASVMLDDETANDDERLRAALIGDYPMVANGLIERLTKNEQLSVSVVTRAVVKCEGQTIAVDLQIARNDKLLTDVLLPYYPSVNNSEITRATVDGKMVVNVVKKSGQKAAGQDGALLAVLRDLAGGAEWINPVLVLGVRLKYQELSGGDLTIEALLELQVPMEQALARGDEEVRDIAETIGHLRQVPPEPVVFVPLGF